MSTKISIDLFEESFNFCMLLEWLLKRPFGDVRQLSYIQFLAIKLLLIMAYENEVILIEKKIILKILPVSWIHDMCQKRV